MPPYPVRWNKVSPCGQILCEVRDMEQLVAEGRRRKACPYYASRRAVKHAQVRGREEGLSLLRQPEGRQTRPGEGVGWERPVPTTPVGGQSNTPR